MKLPLPDMAFTKTNPFDLTGRIALVTGASKGMGRSIAAILAQAGARVVISSRKQADCDKVAVEISPQKGQCVGIASDASDAKSLKALVASTQKQVGKPDILVGNAAADPPVGPMQNADPADVDKAMLANVRNNLVLANLVAPAMAAKKYGSI